MLVLFFRKYHQSISRQKNMEFYHVTGLYPDFYGNKCEKKPDIWQPCKAKSRNSVGIRYSKNMTN